MQKKTTVSLFSSALLALVLASAGSPAYAQTCEEICEAAKDQCLTNAREAQQACQAACRSDFEGAARGECMRVCADDARNARDVCRATFQACKDACEGATTTSTLPTTTSSTAQVSTTSTVATTTTTSTTLPTSPSAAFID